MGPISFVREIYFYFEPGFDCWLLCDNAYVDSEAIDVDSSADFEGQFADACEIVGVIMQERGIEAFVITNIGDAWKVEPTC